MKKDENSTANKDKREVTEFGIVTDEDREADREALEKLKSMIEERLKTNPLPPPPPPPIDNAGDRKPETPVKSKDGDSDGDMVRNGK